MPRYDAESREKWLRSRGVLTPRAANEEEGRRALAQLEAGLGRAPDPPMPPLPPGSPQPPPHVSAKEEPPTREEALEQAREAVELKRPPRGLLDLAIKAIGRAHPELNNVDRASRAAALVKLGAFGLDSEGNLFPVIEQLEHVRKFAPNLLPREIEAPRKLTKIERALEREKAILSRAAPKPREVPRVTRAQLDEAVAADPALQGNSPGARAGRAALRERLYVDAGVRLHD
jgi:hypothetical protein